MMSGQDADRAGNAWAAPGWRESALEYHKHHSRPNKKAADGTALIAQCASLSPIQYDQQRKEAAKQLGIKLPTLDREVANLRAQQKPAQNFLPHWNIEPWPEEVDGAVLLDDLRQQFTRYVLLPAHADAALALWCFHTWVFERFDITPYLVITSPTKRCGKTVLMTLLYWLSCRGKKTDSMSKAAIYRSVDREKPTLVLDEVGWVLDPKDDRQGILCGGFERNGYAEVCEGEGTAITTRLFSTYCPKAFGLIGKLTATLTDRAIVIPMRRKLREKVSRLRRRDNDEFANLRRRCLRWANDNAEALAKAPPVVLNRLNDRALDFWEPLLIITDLVGGQWPTAAREAALALSGDGEDDTTNIVLLRDVYWLFDGKPEAQEDGTIKGEYLCG
jgi:putative DNA primase/helicase